MIKSTLALMAAVGAASALTGCFSLRPLTTRPQAPIQPVSHHVGHGGATVQQAPYVDHQGPHGACHECPIDGSPCRVCRRGHLLGKFQHWRRRPVNIPYHGAPGPPTASVTYPYYTVRGPRDFFDPNPWPIGR